VTSTTSVTSLKYVTPHHSSAAFFIIPTVPQTSLTVHQHRYSTLHPHCSSASTVTPSLDHRQTSITGPSLTPPLHYHFSNRTSPQHNHTNTNTSFVIMKLPTSLRHYTSTTINTLSLYYCTSFFFFLQHYGPSSLTLASFIIDAHSFLFQCFPSPSFHTGFPYVVFHVIYPPESM
jgi:hypothetical protein